MKLCPKPKQQQCSRYSYYSRVPRVENNLSQLRRRRKYGGGKVNFKHVLSSWKENNWCRHGENARFHIPSVAPLAAWILEGNQSDVWTYSSKDIARFLTLTYYTLMLTYVLTYCTLTFLLHAYLLHAYTINFCTLTDWGSSQISQPFDPNEGLCAFSIKLICQ